MSAHDHQQDSSLMSTLAGLVRLLLLVLAVPAVVAGAAVALAVLAIGGPLLLVRKVFRLLWSNHHDDRLQSWSAL
ncbi:MAG: hypothetical protein RIQ60_3949 [Pseudomonadota bacterium]|jgi:hypothetical protein